MNRIIKLLVICFCSAFILLSFSKYMETTNIKCMVQMTNYSGLRAYVIISLIDPSGNYEKTLHVRGEDKEWYSEITMWWKFYGKLRPKIDAISGATIGGGERVISVFKIPNEKIDTGYSIRFESAVEEQGYYSDDVEFKLTSESIKSKVEGKGFIRYVRMMP